MVVLCDDNEMYDNAPRPESHPSLPLELRCDYSKPIDKLSNLLIDLTDLAEDFKKLLKVTNTLYEWHVTQNHFPDTRGKHRYGGRVTLLAAPVLVANGIPAASPTVKGRHTSFNWNAFDRMRHHSSEMRTWIWGLYLNPNNFLDTHYNWEAPRAILFATCPSNPDEFSAATLNSKSCTSLDSNAPMLRIQPESNGLHTPDTIMAGPEARPCTYQDFLDALFVLETRFTVLYEQCKLEHKMNKEMYNWHLNQNHFTEKCSVILSKL